MRLTDEQLEMYEAEARAGCRDSTKANARILKLLAEQREDTEMLAELTFRLCELDPEFSERIQVALDEREVA